MSIPSRGSFRLAFGGPATRAVKALLISTAAVFLFQMLEHLAGSDQLTSLLGLRPVAVWKSLQLWRPVTYLFLHGSFLHIFFNLLSLYFFGPDLERRWGTARFYRYYFVTGIGAGLCTILVGPWSPMVTIGCSGAIYGVLLAYGMNFPNNIVYIYALFPVKVKYMVAGMVVLAFFSSVSGSNDGVAHWAHLGGLVVGFLYLTMGRWTFSWNRYYRRWKLERSKRKFQVYYNQNRVSRDDRDPPPTIH